MTTRYFRTNSGYTPFVALVLAIGFTLIGATRAVAVPSNKVLFDATKAQMAGNADWVVDADLHNIGTGAGGAMIIGAGSESNPGRFPTPAQSGISASTPENFWTGASSSWGIALAKRNMSIETLPVGGRITYGDSSNIQDLSNYGIYIIIEPNILFTASEKTAIISFVSAGGGLFLVGDHSSSDRNNDGADSNDAINGLVTSNGISSNIFGIVLNNNNVSPTSTSFATSATDPLIRGPAGTVTQFLYHAGTTLTISGTNARGAVYQTSARASTAVMVGYSTYGQGRVVVCGDSSPFDDGTGGAGDSLFNGWSGEAAGSHGFLAINACIWLNPPAALPCPTPTILPAVTASTCLHGSVSLTVSTAASGAINRRWRLNGAAISLASNPTATSATLIIGNAIAASAGNYDCIITAPCGSAASNTVALTVTAPCSIADLPTASTCADGIVDGSDFIAFINSFSAADITADPLADVNADGTIDGGDFIDFINAFTVGC